MEAVVIQLGDWSTVPGQAQVLLRTVAARHCGGGIFFLVDLVD
jgi:hypothetical protein